MLRLGSTPIWTFQPYPSGPGWHPPESICGSTAGNRPIFFGLSQAMPNGIPMFWTGHGHPEWISAQASLTWNLRKVSWSWKRPGEREDAGSLVPTPPPLVDPVDPELSRISRMNGQQLIWIFSCGYRAQKRGRRFWALRMKGVRYGVLCTHPFVLSPTIWSSADALWG